jgi:hypothetical protein
MVPTLWPDEEACAWLLDTKQLWPDWDFKGRRVALYPCYGGGEDDDCFGSGLPDGHLSFYGWSDLDLPTSLIGLLSLHFPEILWILAGNRRDGNECRAERHVYKAGVALRTDLAETIGEYPDTEIMVLERSGEIVVDGIPWDYTGPWSYATKKPANDKQSQEILSLAAEWCAAHPWPEPRACETLSTKGER